MMIAPDGTRRAWLRFDWFPARKPRGRAPRLAMAIAAAAMAALVVIPSEPSWGQDNPRFRQTRLRMVKKYIAAEGITNPRVLESMRTTPRHEFVPDSLVGAAYYDAALPIGHKQTISPPYIVAFMTATIDPQPDDVVLEIGTGSGYQAAVLSPLVKEVYTIEIVEELGRSAAERLERLGYDNVHAKIGDGFKGWPEHAPFDKIIVTCSPEDVPQPLIAQLAEGGKLLIPLGKRYQQAFYLFEKKNGKLVSDRLVSTLFVPMTGISAKNREVQPDPLHPQVVNGGFEKDANQDDRIDGWHYLRQTKLLDGVSPNGSHSLRIHNERPGQMAQALQGFAIDGRHIGALRLSAAMLVEKYTTGMRRKAMVVVVMYFDDNRERLGAAGIEVPKMRGQWERYSRVIPVPRQAREAIIGVTLDGGVGTIHFDQVRFQPVRR